MKPGLREYVAQMRSWFNPAETLEARRWLADRLTNTIYGPLIEANRVGVLLDTLTESFPGFEDLTVAAWRQDIASQDLPEYWRPQVVDRCTPVEVAAAAARMDMVGYDLVDRAVKKVLEEASHA